MDVIKIDDLIHYPFKNIPVNNLWSLSTVIGYFRFSTSDLDESLFKPELFKVKEVYDNPHDSDEASERYLLFYQNEFICWFGRTGDNYDNEAEFSSHENKQKLYHYFSSLLTNKGTDRSDIIQNGEIVLSDQYTTLFKHNDEFYYHIQSPYWCGVYGIGMKNLYLLEEDGVSLTSIEFVDFKINRNDWSNKFKPENQFLIVKKKDSYQFEAPFHKLLIKVEKEN